MNKYVLSFCFFAFFSSLAHACGDNPNTIIQGPFRDSAFNDGYICFQGTSDKRGIAFYLSYAGKDGVHNNLVDTYYYADGPVELMSVFFAPVNGERNVVVLLRWKVDYEIDKVQYPYCYEVKTYQKKSDNGYEINLSSEKNDPHLSGCQSKKNGHVVNYSLDNAGKIRRYLSEKYGR